ncbi:zinc finger CCCH domain-containing protein 3 [Magnolia sinica]|uniref:zinc finger CCCH domain-containing protein 3 n=1 Tax=Magnolia sinica TaxID=86752 RepID=UPI00265AF171|nr:zinc finger CCCH domain-containing protein 3 [Magnolia sinica]XP_058076844.1 zinc finger CCCH domain-containing protein 3 [Magnolia sinica]XP_058076845.1 zinc finger CCCH domain-containing protein 3 [Magnolia sinica]XP_058076846.1 zinc finger CCCH domain-containing protein 3 [Magnolia sinica]XP_058076847.1 zinc finger CCCH domain-containing protein 3 [Magnolia sinica]
MPLAKYYCDYCDKQFQDTASARKRHLSGIQHQRAKSLWYDSFKDPYRIQSDGFGKGVCNHFVRTGFCQYGDACKYFHPKQNIQNPTQTISGMSSGMTLQPPIILGGPPVGGPLSGDVVRDGTRISLGNLPPSLQPPPEGGYPHLPFVDWG